MIKNKQAPHFWIKTDGGRRVSVYIEFNSGGIRLDALVNYAFTSVRVGTLCAGDIVNIAYANVLNGKSFFALVRSVDIERHSGIVKLHLDMIESKIQPPSV